MFGGQTTTSSDTMSPLVIQLPWSSAQGYLILEFLVSVCLPKWGVYVSMFKLTNNKIVSHPIATPEIIDNLSHFDLIIFFNFVLMQYAKLLLNINNQLTIKK